MLALVLLAPLDGRQLVALDLARLLDNLGHVAVAPYAFDLGEVRVTLCERLVVLESLSLPRRLDGASLRGVGAPEADVALDWVSGGSKGRIKGSYVVAPAEQVFGVHGPAGTEDPVDD